MTTSEIAEYYPVAIALIPALAGISVAVINRQGGTPRPYRRLAMLVDMMAKAPEGSRARNSLDTLIVVSASRIEARVADTRKINPYTLTWVVIFLGVTAVTMYWLVQWILEAGDSGWAAVAWIVTVIVGLTLTALVAASVSIIYNPPLTPEERKVKKDEKAAARSAR